MKRNKYNAKSTVVNGYRYDSKFEASIATRLEWLKQLGEVIDFKRQFKVDLIVNGISCGKHYVDFLVTFNDGRQEFWEVKGGLATQTPLWNLKKNITKALHPEIKYIVVTK